MIYLASPFTHTEPAVQHARALKAGRACRLLVTGGVLAYSPIAHSLGLVAGSPDVSGSWDEWEAHDKEMVRLCKVLLVLQLDGWERSVGVRAEMAFAEGLGKTVLFVKPEKLDEDWIRKAKGRGL